MHFAVWNVCTVHTSDAMQSPTRQQISNTAFYRYTSSYEWCTANSKGRLSQLTEKTSPSYMGYLIKYLQPYIRRLRKKRIIWPHYRKVWYSELEEYSTDFSYCNSFNKYYSHKRYRTEGYYPNGFDLLSKYVHIFFSNTLYIIYGTWTINCI